MAQGSAPGTLGSVDWLKIIKGGGLAAAGAILSYLLLVLPDLVESQVLPLAAAAFLSTIVNGLIKLLSDTRRLGIVLAVILAGSVSTVGAVEIVLDVAPGTHYVRIQVGEDGTVAASALQRVVIGSPPITPDDPDDPPPVDQFTKLLATVKNLTAQVTDPDKSSVKNALSQLYRTVGTLPVTSRKQLVDATDLLFNALPLAAPWKLWKAGVDSSLVSFPGLDDAKRAWIVVSQGLEN